MPSYVPSYGPLDAKIVILGDAPSHHDAAFGRPFSSSAGALLGAMLESLGSGIKQCRLITISPVPILGRDFRSTYYTHDGIPHKTLIENQNRVREEIRKIKPNVVICLGSEALGTLTGNYNIHKWRGTVTQTVYGKVIGTFHPSFILKVYANRPIAQFDINKAVRESKSRSCKNEKLDCLVSPTLEQVLEFFSRSDIDRCTFDIETLGKKIRCVGFSTDGKSAICVPFMRVQKPLVQGKLSLLGTECADVHYWTREEELLVVQAMTKFFAKEDIKFIAQNFSFDGPLLEKEFGVRIPNFWFDTLHAHRTAFMEFPANLDFLTSIHTNLGYYADYNAKSDKETWIYNCYDVIATYQCVDKILEALDELGLTDLYFDHVHRLSQSITRVSSTGIAIDLEARRKMDEPLEQELAERREALAKRFGRDINPASPKQVAELITKDLGYSIPKIAGKQSTDVRTLDTLKSRWPDEPVFDEILTYREKLKLLGTYVRAPLDADGKMRTSFNPTGTNTGRVSSSQTIWKTGGNLQNIPKTEFRRLFYAPPGFKILKADLAQAEAMEVAWLSKNTELVNKWVNDPNFDIHTWRAGILYDKPEAAVTKIERTKAKACNHSGNYGISYKRFSYISGIPLTEAKILLEKHQSDPYLENWWAATRETLRTRRILETPFGRKRIFYGRLDEETFRQSYGFVPQSTVGDIVNRALYLCDEQLDPDRGWVIATIHDELILQVKENYVTEALKILVKNMQWTHIVHPELPKLTIPTDASIGQNWWDCQEIEL